MVLETKNSATYYLLTEFIKIQVYRLFPIITTPQMGCEELETEGSAVVVGTRRYSTVPSRAYNLDCVSQACLIRHLTIPPTTFLLI